MVLRIESADEARIAYAAGYSGKAEPPGLSAGGRAAFALGKDDHDNGRAKAPNGDIEKAAHQGELTEKGNARRAKSKTGENPPATKPTKTPKPQPDTPDDTGSRASGQGTGGGGTLPGAPQAQQKVGALTDKLSAWGDGGGLLMAVFLYPVLLAMLTQGPSGMTKWLKAKFLNETDPTSTPTTTTPTSPPGTSTLAPGQLPPGVTITPTAPTTTGPSA